MEYQEPYWHALIHQVMPDLEIDHYELHQEGLVNDVLIVNDQWVFRFTKTDWGKELMDLEDNLMHFLQSKLSLSVPSPFKRGDGVLVYPMLEGETFLRKTWQNLSKHDQQGVGDQLGRFLKELHQLDTTGLGCEVPLTLAPVTRETWLDIFQRIVEKIYPLMLPHQIQWVEELFEPVLSEGKFFDYQPSLIHGDLSPYHILYLPAETRLNGVIDFGVAGLGDPATDVGTLLSYYGETLVRLISKAYPSMEDFLPRARFYAQAIDLQWVLLGVETGEKYWYTAHLGNAKDIHSS
jgi:aminoglycoside 2''-phosphotransferase